MIRFLKKYPLFLFLLPLFVVVHLEKELQGVIDYTVVYDKIIILFCFPVLAYSFSYMVLRNTSKASVFSLILMIFFYYTGEIKNELNRILPSSIWQSYVFLFCISVLILVSVFVLLKKKRSKNRKFYFFFNSMLILFLLADFLNIAFRLQSKKYKAISSEVFEGEKYSDSTKPDIYYIVADAYASSEILFSEYGFSNEKFTNHLKEMGFKIIKEQRSNYNYTSYSIASVLNLQYLTDVDTTTKVDDREYLQFLRPVKYNRLISFLEKQNYSIHNHSLFHFKDHPTSIKMIDFWGYRELFDQYNIVNKLYLDAGYNFPEKLKSIFYNPYFVNNKKNRSRTDSVVTEKLIHSLNTPSENPKFVYTHYLKTHPPFYQDSTGNYFKNNVTLKEAYIHNIAAINELLKKIVDLIITNSNRPMVIIIQGDHGFINHEGKNTPKQLLNFCAIYFSDNRYNEIPDRLSNVNTFRIVLNKYFRTNLMLLPDKYYIIK